MDPATVDDTFTWTRGASLHGAPQAERDVDLVGEAIARACRSLFPRWAGYDVREDRLWGAIRGRRYRISRRGFVGQVSVQLFASGAGYRRDVGPPLRLRVVGRFRMAPPPPRPQLPLVPITLGLSILAVAALLFGLGGFGWHEIHRAPSLSPFVDGMGVIAAGSFIVLAFSLIELVLRHGTSIPWSEISAQLRQWLRWPASRAADRRRWSTLREHLAQRVGRASLALEPHATQ